MSENRPTPPPAVLKKLFTAERDIPEVPVTVRERLWNRIRASTAGGSPGGGLPGGLLGIVAALLGVVAVTFVVVQTKQDPTQREVAARPTESAAVRTNSPGDASGGAPPQFLIAPAPLLPQDWPAIENGPGWVGQRGVLPRRVAGRVVEGARPVAGARVTLEGVQSAADRRFERAMLTAPDGTFAFDDVRPWNYMVVAMAAGRQSAWTSISIRSPAGAREAEALILKLSPCESVIAGQANDESGRGVPGTRMRLLPAGAFHGPVVETDADGRYELCVAPGPTVHRLRAEAEGYGAQVLLLKPAGNRIVGDVRLVTEGVIEGVTVRAGDSQPIADVQLYAFPTGETERINAPVMAVADDKGRFQVRGLAPGTYAINAWAADAMGRTAVVATVAAGKVTRGIVRVLQSTATVEVRAYSGGTRVEGVKIRLHQGNDGESYVAYTQSDGRATIHGVFEGLNTVVAPGFRVASPAVVDVNLRANAPVTVELAPDNGR